MYEGLLDGYELFLILKKLQKGRTGGSLPPALVGFKNSPDFIEKALNSRGRS